MVFIPEPGRGTLCISSPGRLRAGLHVLLHRAAGLQPQPDDRRDRRPGVARATASWASSAGDDRVITNVVLMGMGEPLANYPQRGAGACASCSTTWASTSRAGASRCQHLGPGAADLQARRGDQRRAGRLAARADDELRNELVPINRRHPIAELLEACWHYIDEAERAAASPSST